MAVIILPGVVVGLGFMLYGRNEISITPLMSFARAENNAPAFNSKTHGVKPPAVGQTACRLAEMAVIEVPYDTKVLIYETNDTSHDCAWANEKLTTLLGMYKACLLYTSQMRKMRSCPHAEYAAPSFVPPHSFLSPYNRT